jgi:hypothetical protein
LVRVVKTPPKKIGSFTEKTYICRQKGDTIMNTIAIDSNIYKGAESYAKLHNISVTAAIEKAISLFLQKVQPKQKLLETAEFNDALSYVKTLKAKGGKPIPADENSLDALVDKKYAL